MKIYIDEELPKSCASCQFLVHCDQCEGTENYCPLVGDVGYDKSYDPVDPVTPTEKRDEKCPLEHRPHGEWIPFSGDTLDVRMKCSICGSVEMPLARHNFCPNCGADMMREGAEE